MAGRPEHEIWKCFGPAVKDDTHKVSVRPCKGCQKMITSSVERAKHHANGCKDLQALGLWAKATSIVPFTTKVPKVKQDDMDSAIARFVFSMNCSLQIVENPHFHKMLQIALPEAQVPCRKRLAGPLLDRIYDEQWSKFKEMVHGKKFTLG